MSDINRQSLFNKLNPPLFSALESASAFCKLRGNPYVELAHWLHQLMQQKSGDLQQIIGHFALDDQQMARDIVQALDALPRGASAISDLSAHIDEAVERAWVCSSVTFAAGEIRGAHLLLALLTTFNLRQHLLAISAQFARINAENLVQDVTHILNNSTENSPQRSVAENGNNKSTSESALQSYAQDMTALAKAGRIDPVVGRDKEIRQLVDILLRRRQNNPLITGEAGVGKTALVEGLALRIASGDLPPSLCHVQLWSLDIGRLQAGAGMKGEFEARLQAVINEVQQSPVPIILFIDEIHMLIGAGGAQGVGDAANLLKPALARGQLRTIGATTWAEYKKHIEKDPALTRRFQVLQVEQPDEALALKMIRSLSGQLEQHHGVLLLDEALEAAVSLSHRYIPARQLPDKAIALLDTTCARVAVSQHSQPAVLEDYRRQLDALQIEYEIVCREQQLGGDHGARLAQLDEQRRELQAEQEQMVQRWQAETTLAQQIISLRQQLISDDEIPVDDVQRLDWQTQLQDCRQQLSLLQGEQPLITVAVDAHSIAAVVADWTGIPLGRMVKNELNVVQNLEYSLGQRVIGQQHALNIISERVRTARAHLADPNKPVGVFLLCGPSGVGKTETALALAESLYGGEQNLITINMSEFQEPHSVSTLKGAPPGYVGYGEGGVLTEAVRRRPYSLVLLDEVEKAHSDVHELFFQVFDKGWMEDGEGRRIDFRNTLIILTSNVGSQEVISACTRQDGLPNMETLTQQLRQPLLRTFPAALLGRLTVIPFLSLSDEMLENIVQLQLARVAQRLRENYGIAAQFDHRVTQQIISCCIEQESGARRIDSIITNTLLPQISRKLLTATIENQHYSQLQVTWEETAFQCHFC
ncbi:type VI secretion system ATPase TssH [Photorhabdus heterorhabditis]|uniref:type VI secretion system ATPase TssH n=1 Tax=Photorhabdus heterorhabditis TaxID=880156 RepID=UPI00156231F5|nr:type VI secretion system ATPase TssH [Photorhabdus heterorhabditis]NRN28974.1 type VI secretion system ATPase TssH [Photorhabdus heterorhabditis subsp. aluminescens]